jgi:hypothetical protein
MIWNREKLYLEVWQSPLGRLAAKLGVSGTSLKETCVKADIPVPPLGYWNKLAAGKAVPERPPLGPSRRGIERAQFPGPRRPFEDPISNADKEAIAASVSSVAVAPTLRKPHPLIAQLRNDVDFRLNHVGMIANGPLADVVRSEQLTAADGRRFRILDALFKELAKRGWQIKLEAKRHFAAVYEDGQIVFRLNERLRQEFIENPPPTEEIYRLLWQPKRQVLHRTGRLAFEITTYGIGTRSKWEDTADAQMENYFPEILGAFLIGKLHQQKEKQSQEARADRIAEAIHRREAARIETEREMARWNALLEASANRRQAEMARSFIDELAATIHDGGELIYGKSAYEWLEWARTRVDDMDPLKDGAMAAIERIVGKV